MNWSTGIRLGGRIWWLRVLGFGLWLKDYSCPDPFLGHLELFSERGQPRHGRYRIKLLFPWGERYV